MSAPIQRPWRIRGPEAAPAEVEVETVSGDVMEGTYYPGGASGGYGHPEPAVEVEARQDSIKTPTTMFAGILLLAVGVFSLLAVYSPAGRNQGLGAVLCLIAALVLSGTGVHLLVNGVSPRKEKSDGEDTAKNIAIAAMGLGAFLGIVMLQSGKPPLNFYGVVMSFILFVYGFVSITRPKS